MSRYAELPSSCRKAILSALPKDADDGAKQKYREARRISEAMIVNREIDPI